MNPVHFPLTPDWLYWRWPLALLGLLLLVPLWWFWLQPQRRSVIRFSSVSRLAEAGQGALAGARWLLPVLRSLAIGSLCIAAARPQRADTSSRVFAEGIAIQMVVDVSPSMEAHEVPENLDTPTRLAIVKEVFRRFVEGDQRTLEGRKNDLIGIVKFATYADSICPLTLDRAALWRVLGELKTVEQEKKDHSESWLASLEKIRPGRSRQVAEALQRWGVLDAVQSGQPISDRDLNNVARSVAIDREKLIQVIEGFRNIARLEEEGSTAIGDGLALAVERMRQVERKSGSGEQLSIKSRVIVLLTDGENNAGAIEPAVAGELAAKFGIKVYTILVGNGIARRPGASGFGYQEEPVDETDLKKIAELTGGRYFRAQDEAGLTEVYAAIDQLERTRTEERRFERFGDLAGRFVAAAFVLLVLQQFLDATWLRKIP